MGWSETKAVANNFKYNMWTNMDTALIKLGQKLLFQVAFGN